MGAQPRDFPTQFNFPDAPTVGQKYPVGTPGVPIYTWDGQKWTTVGGSIVSASPGSATPLMDNTPAVVGLSTNFSREDHVHPVDTKAVRSDVATSWTEAQKQLARQNANAAPFDAMMMGGLQINGGMEVSQERGHTAVVASGNYVCDGWVHSYSGAMVLSTVSGPSGAVFPGFPYGLVASVSTLQASLGASDYAVLLQPIEGLRIARLGWGAIGAQPITIAFWSAHHRVGVYSGSIRNAANNRSYAFTYTQAAADVAQYNTATIPGDTSGSWAADNTVGIYLGFALGSGGNFTAPSANSWQGGSYMAAPGQINAVAATSDVFRITGVIVLPGNEAPTAARSPFVMRTYDQELDLCKRYYQKIFGWILQSGYTSAGTPVYGELPYDLKRASPSVTGLNVAYNNSNSLGINGSPYPDHAQLTYVNAAAGFSYILADYAIDARL